PHRRNQTPNTNPPNPFHSNPNPKACSLPSLESAWAAASCHTHPQSVPGDSISITEGSISDGLTNNSGI
ncbi:unnamed protein product, partial [Urochloa humidicola]